METRICNKCYKDKPLTLENFRFNKQKNLFRRDCRECERLRHREWLARNKKQQKEYMKGYREKNKEARSIQFKIWYEKNYKHVMAYKARYRDENRDKIRAYKKDNLDRERINTQRRRARIRNLPHDLTEEEWSQGILYFEGKCCYCSIKSDNLTQDHLIPVAKGGGYTEDNIVPACGSCNSSKQDTDFAYWYTRQEFYNTENVKRIIDYLDSGLVEELL